MRDLSGREKQICQLINQGKTLHEAADLLGLTYDHMKARTTIIRAKMERTTTLEAARRAMQEGKA